MSHRMGHQQMGQMSREMRQAIESASNCYQVCKQTIVHCLQEGGKHVEPDHMKTMMDCAEICQVSTSFMLTNSRWHGQVCGICAEICEACEESCRQFPGDQMMQQCADACRRCAEDCRRMATSSA